METRLRIFVGSSSEQLHIAKAIQANLEPQFEVTVWDQGVFHLSLTTLESLINRLRVTDVAIFVFGPDDVTTLRGRRHKAVLDNIVFELGLFLGALGASIASSLYLMARKTLGFLPISPESLMASMHQTVRIGTSARQ